MKVLTVVGARPQFIKAAPLSAALRAAGHEEFLVHTGQHYDDVMSRIFFDELQALRPAVNLAVGSGPHGWQTAQMLTGLEKLITEQRPDWVLVYGDTNSTLAGGLAAAKLRVPLAHVEAGLRSFNREMPEEHNRVLVDHCADLLLCPTQTATGNLAKEGLSGRLVGDTMLDIVLSTAKRTLAREAPLMQSLSIIPEEYLVATVHRPYNTDDPAVLTGILTALYAIGETVILPLHPRTGARLAELPEGAADCRHVRLIEPLGYVDMLHLQRKAKAILTDSGGMQKEAYFHGVPCITLRPETEWVETVDAGWNVLVGSDPEQIVEQARTFRPSGERPALFGEGKASEAIVKALEEAR